MSYATLEDAITRGHGTERPFRCPVHDDRHASASVNVLKGLWYCYTCGAHGKANDVHESDIRRFGRDIEELLQTSFRTYSESWLEQFQGKDDYWLTRFCKPAIDKFKLGWHWQDQMPCYPMRGPDETIWGVVRRNLGSEGPKYLYPHGPKKSKTLFHYSANQRDVVFLCEGAMDVVACWEAGVEAFGLYGAQLSNDQLKLIHRVSPKRIALVLDNDKAGRVATEQIGSRLSLLGYDVHVVDWDGCEYKDIGEVPRAERKTLLDPLAL